MVSNEDDIGLREILPMVLLAFKGSEIAEKYGQKIRSKIVFVYRSIDTNDKGKIKGSKQKLSRYLKDAAREVNNLKSRLDCWTEGHNQPESSCEDSEVGLKLDFTSDDHYTDIKFFGNLKRGSNPPADTPEWDYGENVLQLREYLHKRVVDDTSNNVPWEASSFEEWGKRLTMVWNCILTSNFEISFRTQMQYASYLELHKKMNIIRSEVSKVYFEAFKSFENIVLENPEKASDIHCDAAYVRPLKLRDAVDSKRQEVLRLFETNKAYNEWKASVLAQWDLFCSQTDHWYQKRIDDLVNGEVKFKQVIEEYQLKCKEEIVNNYDSRIWGADQIDREQMQERFEKLFEKIVKSAKDDYPPISASIHKQITQYYTDNGLADVLKSGGRLSSIFSRGSKTVPDERLRQRLEFMIEDKLKFEKQYSAHAVDRVIQRTNQILSEAGSRKDAKLSGHRWVYDKLINAMTVIQDDWDEEHNVAKKLQSDEIKGSLQRFFEDVSQGLESSILLANQLEHVLKTEIKNAFEIAVVRHVLGLIPLTRLTNQEVVRQVLDYHLLCLCERKDEDQVIFFVTSASHHFSYFVKQLVSHKMSEASMKQLWETLVQSLVQCLREPPNGRTTAEGFIATLSLRLTEVMKDITVGDISLPIALRSIYVRNEHERSTDLSATDFYSKKLPKLCGSLQQEPMPMVKDHLVGKVMKDMEGDVDESWRCR
ncbi:hypothetical protein KP509_22G001400 [Ceratopteris richardii]|uniref:Uncharacterized protein n=1 Tax=Ceratopteris richardii TaxID=49495 RepID=A0A8T2S2X1_CERRI|nr:hypothetical protein KP509_22G001400 [Ceratopteris richardii]